MARRVLVLGATGTIGRAVVRTLLQAGHDAVAVLRPASADAGGFADARVETVEVADAAALRAAFTRLGSIDAVVSCLASRTGVAADAWAVDHQANLNALNAARAAGAGHFVLLSAICVQKPRLAFQHAKLAFERELQASNLRWSIVRPTAFFKSLSGQVERVRQGKPFLVFGDGTLTACKPIADDDLARYLVGCLDDPARHGRILPIGGPGEAITPRRQGQMLAALLGREPRFRSVPAALLDGVAGALSLAARAVPPLAAKAELARIGRYYATESMLVWDEAAQRYDADATPSFGTQTLADHYAALLAGTAAHERREHAVF
jgi:divinyl chlorophyllide a 8-vinyl-reductase